ncbi:MFS transporter [Actinomyces culturomici]|uniref:MFS transporter n=1 Tax=Actinomyces culturomici TaxID=1926276 RepID=UPI000E206995|nr:MFS transporter [Actinomyces culturomici]
MLSRYLDVLRINRAWRFSAAGLVLRLPMSMIGISIILLIKASYGNYSLAGLVSAVNVVATALAAPSLARLVDRRGQSRVMLPALAVCSTATTGLLVASVLHAPPALVLVLAAIAGATWGSPGAMVRARWASAVERPGDLQTAYAFESSMDEVVYILGPVFSTVLGTLLHPGVGVGLIVVFLLVGGIGFYSQRASEPAPAFRVPGEKRRSVLRIPAIVVMVLTYIGAGMMFGANDVAVVDFAAALGAPAMSGVLLAVFSFGSLMSGLLYGARVWRSPLWRLFALGVLGMGVGTTTFLLAHSLWTMALAMTIAGVACAPTMTNVNTIIARVVDADSLTEGLTWVSTSLNIGLSIGSALAGPAVDASGSHGGYLVMVGAAWAMVALMLVGLPTLRRATESAHSPSAD